MLAGNLEGIDVQIMVDSGATGLYVHERIASQIPMKQKDMKDPYDLAGFNGSDQGRITRELRRASLAIDRHSEVATFDVCDMKYDVVLGMPWLENHNPSIDWKARKLVFDRCQCQSKSKPKVKDASFSQAIWLQPTKGKTLASSEPRPEPVEFEQHYPDYRDIAEEKFGLDSLPEHQPWDHKIEIRQGAKPPVSKQYPMSPAHQRALGEFVQKYAKKGYIRKSTSEYAAPILFVPKKNGELRLCVDYRKLNAITVPNKYPLPRIDEMIDHLQGAVWFTAIDVRDAYYRVRIYEGEEFKTAFIVNKELWEFTVMPMGLTNAPATFQNLMNDTLEGLIGVSCVVYLDDILVFSKTLEEHKQHVRQVLERLRQRKLPIKLEKCEFHKHSVKFLGMVVSKDGLQMDQSKVESVLNWPEPGSIKEVQAFLGLANFYRRFVEGFSRVAEPLTALTKKTNEKFVFNDAALRAFQLLKARFTSAPFLIIFDPELPIVLETDASNGAIAAIMTHVCKDGKRRPVAFFSKKLTKAEFNYTVHDKELYAIVAALKHWKAYLLGTREPITIYSDHKNLLYWNTTKVLTQRQVRWSEELSVYNFRIYHVRGKENGGADALSRRPDYMQDLKNDPIPLLRQEGDYLTYAQPQISAAEERVTLFEEIKQAYGQEETDMRSRKIHSVHWEQGVLWYEHRLWVPQPIREKVITLHHDDKTAGHYGADKTIEVLTRNYYWPKMRETVRDYISQCDVCNKVKPSRHKPYGLLQPLPAPTGPWKSISMDFITKLPKSKEPFTGLTYDSILVICDRMTKYSYFMPYRESSTAEDLSYVYLRNIFANHGLPEEIISDRDKLFTSKFWKSLMKLLDTKHKPSTAFHPPTDGQTERTNQTLEQYLRCYLNYRQTNWVELLPMAQFCFNNHKSATGITPFFANYGLHPEYKDVTGFQPNEKATIKAEMMQRLHEELKTDLEFLSQRMSKYANQKRSGGPALQEGDKVYLIRKNIKTKRPSSKLDYVKLGPFKIKEKKGPVTFILELPKDMRIHPTFHISLLEPAPKNAKLATSVPIDEDMTNNEYDIEHVLKQKIIRGKPYYLIKWLGYDESENSWEPETNLSATALSDLKKNHPEWFAKTTRRPTERRQKPTRDHHLMMVQARQEHNRPPHPKHPTPTTGAPPCHSASELCFPPEIQQPIGSTARPGFPGPVESDAHVCPESHVATGPSEIARTDIPLPKIAHRISCSCGYSSYTAHSLFEGCTPNSTFDNWSKEPSPSSPAVRYSSKEKCVDRGVESDAGDLGDSRKSGYEIYGFRGKKGKKTFCLHAHKNLGTEDFICHRQEGQPLESLRQGLVWKEDSVTRQPCAHKATQTSGSNHARLGEPGGELTKAEETTTNQMPKRQDDQLDDGAMTDWEDIGMLDMSSM